MIKRFGLIAVMLVLTAVMILDFKINEPFLRFFESMVEVDLSARSEMQTQTIEIEEGERLFIEVDESRLNLEPTKKKSLTVSAQSEDAVSVVRSEDGTVLKVLEGSVATVSLPEAILPQVTAYGASVYVSVNVAEIDARSSYLSLTDVKTGKIKAADSYVQLTNSTPEIIETTRCKEEKRRFQNACVAKQEHSVSLAHNESEVKGTPKNKIQHIAGHQPANFYQEVNISGDREAFFDVDGVVFPFLRKRARAENAIGEDGEDQWKTEELFRKQTEIHQDFNCNRSHYHQQPVKAVFAPFMQIQLPRNHKYTSSKSLLREELSRRDSI
jgi:hypothetical protein